MTEKVTKTITSIFNYSPAIMGSSSGITVLFFKPVLDQLLNSFISIVTAMIIATLTFFLNRFLKGKFK